METSLDLQGLLNVSFRFGQTLKLDVSLRIMISPFTHHTAVPMMLSLFDVFVRHMLTCKKLIRNLVIRGKEI